MDLFTYNDLDIVPDKESAFKITIYRLVKAGIVERLGLTTQMSNIIQIGANFDKKQLNRGKYTIWFIRQWNNITRSNIYFLQLLDSIRFIKSTPDTTIDQSFNRLAFLIGELSDK